MRRLPILIALLPFGAFAQSLNTTPGQLGYWKLLTDGVDPSDEQCLTYEATGTSFQWGACGAGGGTANILDLGDDAGNDSIDLVEIATSGDTNSIFTEPSADKLLINLALDWPKADTADDLTCTNCIGPTEISDLTLGTDTAGNYVASVATTAPITGGAAGSEGAALTIACNVASGSQPGCLASADWTTFNNKLSAEVDGSTTNELQNLFETVTASAGTSPVADSTTDTLGFVSFSPILVTGSAGADSISISLVDRPATQIVLAPNCNGIGAPCETDLETACANAKSAGDTANTNAWIYVYGGTYTVTEPASCEGTSSTERIHLSCLSHAAATSPLLATPPCSILPTGDATTGTATVQTRFASWDGFTIKNGSDNDDKALLVDGANSYVGLREMYLYTAANGAGATTGRRTLSIENASGSLSLDLNDSTIFHACDSNDCTSDGTASAIYIDVTENTFTTLYLRGNSIRFSGTTDVANGLINMVNGRNLNVADSEVYAAGGTILRVEESGTTSAWLDGLTYFPSDTVGRVLYVDDTTPEAGLTVTVNPIENLPTPASVDDVGTTATVTYRIADCDNATTSKMLYSQETKQWTCGTDQTGAGSAWTAYEFDFGTSAKLATAITVTDAGVGTGSKLMFAQSGIASTGRQADEEEMDSIQCRGIPAAGTFKMVCTSLEGATHGLHKINYQIN